MKFRISYNSPVVISFSILCALAYLLLQTIPSTKGLFVLSPNFSFGSFSNIFSLFGHALGHASTEHLMGNLTFILLLGPILESRYGGKALLIMIASTALLTGVVNLILFSNGILGASGIVFMFIILSSLVNFKSGELPLTFILVVLLFLGKEIWNSFADDQVSQFAHIFGGIMGSIFGFFFQSTNK